MSIEKISFYLLDAARLEWLLPIVTTIHRSYQTLYSGKAKADLAGVAPYLFSSEHHSDFPNTLWKEANGNSWGIFLISNASFEEVFKHFRKFLIVKTEDGRKLYFRFYDPRVLRIFLPTCSQEQLVEFFGPVERFIVEDEDPEYVLVFSLNDETLKKERCPATDFFEPTELTLLELSESMPEADIDEKKPDIEEEADPELDNAEMPKKNKWDFF